MARADFFLRYREICDGLPRPIEFSFHSFCFLLHLVLCNVAGVIELSPGEFRRISLHVAPRRSRVDKTPSNVSIATLNQNYGCKCTISSYQQITCAEFQFFGWKLERKLVFRKEVFLREIKDIVVNCCYGNRLPRCNVIS